jgi:hypothetical protein
LFVCKGRCMTMFSLCSLFCSLFFTVFISVSFDLSIIRYVFHRINRYLILDSLCWCDDKKYYVSYRFVQVQGIDCLVYFVSYSKFYGSLLVAELFLVFVLCYFILIVHLLWLCRQHTWNMLLFVVSLGSDIYLYVLVMYKYVCFCYYWRCWATHMFVYNIVRQIGSNFVPSLF